MRADRLLNILLHLQAKGKTTAKELSSKLEVSERTVHRDMEALSAAGIPIYAERGVGGGWILSDGYRTNLTGMKREEVLSLFLLQSSRILEDLGRKKDFDSAFLKLLAALPPAYKKDAETVRQRIHIDGAGWNQAIRDLPLLPILQDAIWEDRKVEILYEKEGQTSPRLLEPLGLVAKDTVWYLVARRSREIRIYRISRIRNTRLTEERFERPKKFDLAKYWEVWLQDFQSRLPQYTVRIKITTALEPRIRNIPYAKITKTFPSKKGWSEMELDLETQDWATGILMRFGSEIEVLHPPELKDSILKKAKELLNLYEPSDS
ncbi:WYL domain protein [Leptospira broomii serovar Hurstbridge str. 5399]|uniref:WYL domain protein n=1 Tax=Leptospira broomii serovar Hurstbridge str. 5399 TaxID=1049789 RepID=T0EZ60_9LEPT|nr:YafY family protein [Leptospira broomii]EQA44150.1 WYL domain protein [Leptospira broomii serovar Hurstbridge str. 5399]